MGWGGYPGLAACAGLRRQGKPPPSLHGSIHGVPREGRGTGFPRSSSSTWNPNKKEGAVAGPSIPPFRVVRRIHSGRTSTRTRMRLPGL